MEYRINFLWQALFMAINDTMFIMLWYFLFSAIPLINGYSMTDAIAVYGISAFAYGLLAAFMGNRRSIWEIITEGKLDLYLSQPIDELFHALISKSNADGFGDILFGIVVLAIIAPHSIPLALLVGVLGAVVLLSFTILSDSLGFVLERPRSATRSFNNLVLGFGSWPIDAFGGARGILYAVPIAFLATVPYHVLQTHSLAMLLSLVAVAGTMLAIALLVWKFGVRRYESGNLIATRG